MSLNYIPDDAPFDSEQKVWLNNLIGNFINDLTSGKGLAGSGSAEVVPVKILFGSQTGNSEALSKKLAKAMAKGNFSPEVVDMGDYDNASLTSEKNLLIITSTYGDGEPPDNAADLHEFLLSDEAPRLENINYSILALGDTEYPDFCKCGIEFDERLAALGATRITDRVDCDVDYDEPFNEWKSAIFKELGATATPTVITHEEEEEGYSKTNPFPSEILTNYNLNTEGSLRETHHIEFSLKGSSLEYQAGDALSVLPINPEEIVDEIIKGLPFNTNEEVPLPNNKGEAKLKEALLYHYDIRSLSKGLIEEWQKRSFSPFLNALVEAGSKEQFDDFIWGREIIDLVNDYPADFEDGEEFVSILKKLQPRLYSISSSPKAHPDEVHLTVAIVRYHSNYRDRGGVCSTFLSDRADGVKPKVFVHANKAFRLPENLEKPIIMVGPGTGIAPFRAFLEERRATNATGKNWLFFGNPHASTDFLYKNEIEGMQADGTLSKLDTAFSRDQKEKIYVQDRMLEAGQELWKWLNEEGAYFYVCGDASRMAKDVDAALHTIAKDIGGLSEQEAIDYYKQLKKEKRYARDVY